MSKKVDQRQAAQLCQVAVGCGRQHLPPTEWLFLAGWIFCQSLGLCCGSVQWGAGLSWARGDAWISLWGMGHPSYSKGVSLQRYP